MSLNRNLNGLGLGIKKKEGVEREELGKAMYINFSLNQHTWEKFRAIVARSDARYNARRS